MNSDPLRCYNCAYYRPDVSQNKYGVPTCPPCQEFLRCDALRIENDEIDRRKTFSLTR